MDALSILFQNQHFFQKLGSTPATNGLRQGVDDRIVVLGSSLNDSIDEGIRESAEFWTLDEIGMAAPSAAMPNLRSQGC